MSGLNNFVSFFTHMRIIIIFVLVFLLLPNLSEARFVTATKPSKRAAEVQKEISQKITATPLPKTKEMKYDIPSLGFSVVAPKAFKIGTVQGSKAKMGVRIGRILFVSQISLPMDVSAMDRRFAALSTLTEDTTLAKDYYIRGIENVHASDATILGLPARKFTFDRSKAQPGGIWYTVFFEGRVLDIVVYSGNDIDSSMFQPSIEERMNRIIQSMQPLR